ncbi:MAG: hypothetical protein NVSMB9_03480 [Isosphaeraceae bacterium]
MSNSVSGFLSGMPWFAWVAIVAIISSGLGALAKLRYRHLERIGMVRQGIHPDGAKSGIRSED